MAERTLIYLLSCYDEYGAEMVHAYSSWDQLKLAAMGAYGHGKYSAQVEKSLAEIDPTTPIWVDGQNLTSGWGGLQVHIVELDARSEFVWE